MIPKARLMIKVQAPAIFGGDVLVVGNKMQLGEWQPNQAVRLKKRNDGLWELYDYLEFPKCKLFSYSATTLEFKLIMQTAEGNIMW